MSPTRMEPQQTPIELDLSGVFRPETGLSRADFLAKAAALDTVRANYQILRQSNDAASASLVRLLDEYKTNRRNGLLGRILAAAKKLRDAADRAVLLSSPSAVGLAQALFAACCHPFHNDLPRGHRGGRPRVYFAPANADNDLLQGLLDALNAPAANEAAIESADNDWSLVIADDGTGRQLVAELSAVLLDSLPQRKPHHPASVFVVCDESSPLVKLSQRFELTTITIPNNKSPLLHPGVLLAASVMGMDIVKLLRGAVFSATRFALSPPGDNPAFDLAILPQLAAGKQKLLGWEVEASVSSLQPLADWLSRDCKTFDSKFFVQLITEAVRFDRLRVKLSAKGKASVYLNDLAGQQTQAVAEKYWAKGIPTAAIRIRNFDEHAIGQILETLEVAQRMANDLAKNFNASEENA
jgi:hypothetical protein